MLRCEKCGRNGVYISSDKINAWCRYGCGNYAHFSGELIYVGKFSNDPQMLLRFDGGISKVVINRMGDRTVIEEERLAELEKQLMEKVRFKKERQELLVKAGDWWMKLSPEERVRIWRENTL